MISNKENLREALDQNFKDHLLVIVSNREPYLHTYNKNHQIICQSSIGGVSVIFDQIMQTAKGVWVAYGGSLADKDTVDKTDHILVPPQKPSYTLRRVWMTDQERDGYYSGFSNQTLYPICLTVFVRPTFLEKDWKAYVEINKRFADVVLEEIKGKKAIVWIQDYHLALAAKYIRKKRPDAIIAHFWHIPWPGHEVFRVCPWKKEILDGLLSSDLIGFHRYQHVENFMHNISAEMEVNIDRENSIVGYKGRKIKIKSFPLSVDFENIHNFVSKNKPDRNFLKKYIDGKYKYLALGIDRLDYTKGIPNRLLAIERFLAKNPKYHGKFSYLGIAAPSRTDLESYSELKKTTQELSDRINQKYTKGQWKPIYHLNKIVDNRETLKLANAADVALVTPLDDGMNMVAKEYVAANKGNGCLVLSNNIGAAIELTDSFQVNPYDIEDIAENIKLAITCPSRERKERMMKMKQSVGEKNVYYWATKFLLEMADIEK